MPPPSLPNKPDVWLDFSRPVYGTQDGYTLVSGDGASFNHAPDWSNHGRHARSQPFLSGSPASPTLATGAINSLNALHSNGSAKRLFIPPFLNKTHQRNFCYMLVIKHNITLGRCPLSFGPEAVVGTYRHTPSPTDKTILTPFPLPTGGITSPYSADTATGVMSFRYDGTNMIVGWNGQYQYLNGDPNTGSLYTGTVFGDLLIDKFIMGIGDPTNDNYDGEIGEFLVFGEISLADFDKWEQYLVAKWNLYSTSHRRIFCIGDSLTQGNPTTHYPYPCQLQVLLGNTYAVSNFGTNSATADSLTRLSPARERFLIRPNDVAIVWAGTNDMSAVGGSQSAATTWTRLQAIYALLRSYGAKVISCTVTPREDIDISASINTLNSSISTNAGSVADTVCDLAAVLPNPSDGTKFDTDKLHLLTAGNADVASALQTSIGLV